MNPPHRKSAFAPVRLALAAVALMAGPAQAGSGATTALPVQEVAPGVFVHFGHHETSTRENLGDIANVGFIIGADCVAIIDSGGSAAVGGRLRQAVRSATSKPVCHVINTHVHPDHIFGNAAFRDDRPAFVGHRRLAAAMAARGGNYRNALLRDLGAAAAGSEVVPPTLEIQGEQVLDLGNRPLRLKAWPTAHTDNDLSVFDEASGTLWLSDLLFAQRIPVVDGSLKGWLAVLRELTLLEPRRVIAGHGATADWRAALAAQERYLRTLLDETRAAIKAGITLQRAVEVVGQGERERWLLFDDYHRRNVTAAYAELEWED